MNFKAYLAEFIGTFALIFVGVGAIAADHMSSGASGLVGIALAHGLTIAVMVSATAAGVLAAERAAMACEEVATDQLAGLAGTRRALRVRADCTLTFEQDAARLVFDLPAGSYATTVVEELRKRFAPV